MQLILKFFHTKNNFYFEISFNYFYEIPKNKTNMHVLIFLFVKIKKFHE